MKGSANDGQNGRLSDSTSRLVWHGKWEDLLVRVLHDRSPGSTTKVMVSHQVSVEIHGESVSIGRGEILPLARMLLAAAHWIDEHEDVVGTDRQEDFERRSQGLNDFRF